MSKRNLVLHVPVIHQGYLDFFKDRKGEINKIFLLEDSFLSELSDYKPSIASIKTPVVKKLLESLGFSDIRVLTKAGVHELSGHPVLLINDDVSRKLFESYLQGEDVEWASVFLRRNRQSVFSEESFDGETSSEESDKSLLKEAYNEAEKSGDQWRQVGAVLVKNGEITLRAYNKGIPSDHTPYQIGDVRDFIEVGERPDLSSTIHSEQEIISKAAKEGISLEGTKLYVTHFPCSVCAKLIAHSGISECFFGEGSSSLDGEAALVSGGVKIKKVELQ